MPWVSLPTAQPLDPWTSEWVNNIQGNINYLLAPNYFSYYEKATVSYSTTSTTAVDVHENLTKTITMNGGHLLLIISGNFYVTSASYYGYLDIAIDGTRIGHSTSGFFVTGQTLTDWRARFLTTYLVPAETVGTGSKQVKLQWWVSGGTAYLTAQLGAPLYFIGVEI